MLEIESDSLIKETLKNVCCSYGWSYGIFWGFDQTNSLLLTLKDAYYEEHMGALIDYMLLQVHILDKGVIGQAACNNGHRWMFSDHYPGRQNAFGSFEILEVFEDDSELYCQFSMGIKTIALIPVEELGVVHLGSTHMISESNCFVDQVKNLFTEINDRTMKSENEPSSNSRYYDSKKQFISSLSYSICLNDNLQCGADSEGFLYTNHSSCRKSHQQSFEDFLSEEKSTLLLDPTDCEAQGSSVGITLEDLFQDNNFPMDDLSQWFFPLPNESNISFATSLNNELIEVPSLSENESPISISENLLEESGRSSVTEAFGSNCGTKKMHNGLDAEKNGRDIVQRLWNETLIPVMNDDDTNLYTDETLCISERYAQVRTPKSLLSGFGSNPHLDNIASSSCLSSGSRFEDRLPCAPKRRRIENYSWSSDRVKIRGLPTFDEKLRTADPSYGSETISIIEPIIKASAMETISCIMPKSREEPAKTVKKVKGGTKPRPKDRQMIQDCLAELRKLIPNGEKMSIDRLLERTIKHLNFMLSITKHAETLKQIEKTKNGAVLRDHSSNVGGVTWACEVGDRTMVCPLLIEDLNMLGLMRIEILYEKQSFFLEIVSIIRSFGLIIVKGVMEVRETKICAHFIVQSQGDLPVTRQEIFSSLVWLLQMTGHSADDTDEDLGDIISSGAPSFDDYLPVSLPVNLADTFQDSLL